MALGGESVSRRSSTAAPSKEVRRAYQRGLWLLLALPLSVRLRPEVSSVRWRKHLPWCAWLQWRPSGWLAWALAGANALARGRRRSVVLCLEDPRRTTAALILGTGFPRGQKLGESRASLPAGNRRSRLPLANPGTGLALARSPTLTCGRRHGGQLTCLADWIRSQSGALPLGPRVTLVTDQPHLPQGPGPSLKSCSRQRNPRGGFVGVPSTGTGRKTRCGACADQPRSQVLCAPPAGDGRLRP